MHIFNGFQKFKLKNRFALWEQMYSLRASESIKEMKIQLKRFLVSNWSSKREVEFKFNPSESTRIKEVTFIGEEKWKCKVKEEKGKIKTLGNCVGNWIGKENWRKIVKLKLEKLRKINKRISI